MSNKYNSKPMSKENCRDKISRRLASVMAIAIFANCFTVTKAGGIENSCEQSLTQSKALKIPCYSKVDMSKIVRATSNGKEIGNPESKTTFLIIQGFGRDNTTKFIQEHSVVLAKNFVNIDKVEFNGGEINPPYLANTINENYRNLDYTSENPAKLTLNGTSMGGNIAIAIAYELAKIPASERVVIIENIIQDSTPTHFDNITTAPARWGAKNHEFLGDYLPEDIISTFSELASLHSNIDGGEELSKITNSFWSSQLSVSKDVQNKEYPLTDIPKIVTQASGKKTSSSPDSINYDVPNIYYMGANDDQLVDTKKSYEYINQLYGSQANIQFVSTNGAGHTGYKLNQNISNAISIYDEAINAITEDINKKT